MAPSHKPSVFSGFLLITYVIIQATQLFTPVSKDLPNWQLKQQGHPDCWKSKGGKAKAQALDFAQLLWLRAEFWLLLLLHTERWGEL